MSDIGAYLKEQRLKKGVELKDISATTHISQAILKDIEENNFNKYKGDEQYLRMYIKKYALFLGLDFNILVEDYFKTYDEIEAVDEQEILSNELNKIHFKKSKVYLNSPYSSIGKYVYLTFLGLLIVILLWYVINWFQNRNTVSFTEPNEVIENNNDNSDNTPIIDNELEELEPEENNLNNISFSRTGSYTYEVRVLQINEPLNIKIEFVGRSWSMIRLDGNMIDNINDKIFNNENISNVFDALPEVVEFSFNLDNTGNILSIDNGFNMYHRYYVNDIEIIIDESDYFPGHAIMTFNFVKEG